MSSSSADGGAGTCLRSADHIHFYTRFYYSLKGWCYLPAGIILAVATLATAVMRPAWLDTGWLILSLLGGSVLLTAPLGVLHATPVPGGVRARHQGSRPDLFSRHGFDLAPGMDGVHGGNVVLDGPSDVLHP